jgi:two-component system cell cycle response regulator
MLHATHSGQMDSVLPRQTELPATQSFLLTCCEQAETRLLIEYLADIYHLFPAAGESEIFDVLENHPIDLIVINGGSEKPWDHVEFCSLLKSMPSYAHLPIIVLIPSNNTDTRMKCLQSGADACMEMPLSRDYLRVQIKNLLANRRLVRNHLSRSLTSNYCLTTGKRKDSAFLRRLNSFIIKHLSDPGLNVNELARLMNISPPTLYRKIKLVSDLTPNELINMARLDKAAALLTFGGYKVFEIVKMVGFHSRSNFGKAFTRQFGITPKEYQQMAVT